jgi:AcrR family transcriptional regulator
MNHADPQTIKNINEAAMKEFIAHGYKNASLRSIAREARVTTGAFYGYYKSKADVFDGIVREHADYLKELFSPGSDSYEDFGKSRLARLIVYTFDNIDAVRLLVAGSEGTVYAELFHELMKRLGYDDEEHLSIIRTLSYIHMVDWTRRNQKDNAKRLNGCLARLKELLSK